MNSLSLFWLAESILTVNFWNQHLWGHLAADYTVIMSRTLEVTNNHVMYHCGAWFPRVIMSSLHALCCLASVKKKKNMTSIFFIIQCIVKQLLDSVFMTSRIIQSLVRVVTLSLLPWLIIPASTLIILDITETSWMQLLFINKLIQTARIAVFFKFVP